MLKYALLFVLLLTSCSICPHEVKSGIGQIERDATVHGSEIMNREFYEADREYYWLRWSHKF